MEIVRSKNQVPSYSENILLQLAGKHFKKTRKLLLYRFAVIQSKSLTATRENLFQSEKMKQENFEAN